MASDPERLLQLVEAADIVETDGDGYTITAAFAEHRAAARDRLATESAADLVPDALDLDRAALLDPDRSPELAAVLAVRELADVDWVEAVGIASALTRFDDPHPELPAAFVPLAESEIAGFLRANPLGLVVFWSDESPACTTVLDDLDELAAAGELDDIALGAVYAPEATAFSREEYQVNVVPTTLFCIGERVDSRLIGAFPPRAFLAEVETIRERA